MYIYSYFGHRGLDFKLSLYLAIFNFPNKLLIKVTPLPLTLPVPTHCKRPCCGAQCLDGFTGPSQSFSVSV